MCARGTLSAPTPRKNPPRMAQDASPGGSWYNAMTLFRCFHGRYDPHPDADATPPRWRIGAVRNRPSVWPWAVRNRPNVSPWAARAETGRACPRGRGQRAWPCCRTPQPPKGGFFFCARWPASRRHIFVLLPSHSTLGRSLAPRPTHPCAPRQGAPSDQRARPAQRAHPLRPACSPANIRGLAFGSLWAFRPVLAPAHMLRAGWPSHPVSRRATLCSPPLGGPLGRCLGRAPLLLRARCVPA